MMDLIHLRSLVTVADCGSVGEAARALSISQPAMSRRLRLLEQHFETDLLVRQGRGVMLSEAGRLVAREGGRLVERFDRLHDEVGQLNRLESGVIRLGGGSTFVGHRLANSLGEFSALYPEVRFEVREAGSSEIEEAVIAEEIELGVVTEPEAKSELEVMPLLEDKIVLVAGRKHPLYGKSEVALSEIDGQNLIGFEAGSAIRRLIDHDLREAQIQMRVSMELRSVAAILRLVDSTSSLTFLSELVAPAAAVLSVAGLEVKRNLALVTKKGRPLSPAVQAFSRLLRIRVQEEILSR